MISIVSLSTLGKKIQDIFYRKNILALECFIILCCITFLPLAASLIYCYNCNSHLSFLESQLLQLRERYKTLQEYEIRQLNYKNVYLQSNPYYLQDVAERIIPLKNEIEFLKMILPFYPSEHSRALKKRLHFLESENRLEFREVTRNKYVFLDEITLEQVTPVELNMHDLQTVLFQLEGISDKNNPTVLLDRPQILISHLDLYKEKDSDRDTFMINMQVIQRQIKK